MGVPGFFGWLIKNYRHLIVAQQLNNNNTQIRADELYIDANCMLHPSCMGVLKSTQNKLTMEELEEMMIKKCIDDLNNLIKYVNPTQKIYIAIDGVAPVAKMSQQRKRRYKSAYDEKVYNEIREKYSVKQINTWTNANITPGTEFMEKLHQRMTQYIEAFLKTNSSFQGEIIYSSYHVSGEGEHKIFNHIREINDGVNGVNGEMNEKVRVIYGLDADLIFLSMSIERKNMYLIREANEIDILRTNDNSVFRYIVIDQIISCFKEQLLFRIENLMNSEENYMYLDEQQIMKYISESVNLTKDIIFICYLMGNDFIPHVPSIDIKKMGLDLLLDTYVVAFIRNFQNKNRKVETLISIRDGKPYIDPIFLDEFLTQLTLCERKWFETYDDNFRQNLPCFETLYERDIWMLENMKIIQSNDVFQRHIGTFDDWKFRYYNKHFHCNESQEATINIICKNYMEGLQWIANYYFVKCVSWEWQYCFDHAPFVCDLCKFFKSYKFDINNIPFELGNPVAPITQLLCVIPPKYFDIIPKKVINEMRNNKENDIGYMFPEEYQLDTYNKNMYWQCTPILPVLDIKKIRSIIEKCYFSVSEKERNIFQNDMRFSSKQK
jgi:5'-3' exonuclease